ncbi:MAG: hypothetical protein CVU56_04765 [Deltaproteobacteria bacterium HGW-Deltaproteobacteria-14]|jgi:hypothetical protein|nr:MAG: hypothetical protein CVU56_04765 [Deltaproteobacteria bacterium HGW-Deltaproteobacteria-14]
MNRIALLLAMILATATSAGGCLEAGRGGASSDTGGGDTVATDTSVQSDTTVDLCAGESCDDGDPCTYDECEATTGECQHYQVPSTAAEAAYPMCVVDKDCDDGDPCTADNCVPGAGGCGTFEWAYCSSEPIAGCGGCQVAGCSDGNPCTLDVCKADGSCEFVPAEDCAFGCSGVDVRSHSDAMYGVPVGTPVKLAGAVAPAPYAYCDDGLCECSGGPGLMDTAGAVMALSASALPDGDDSTWYCYYNYCSDQTPVCAPLLYDAAYWAWGTTYSRYDLAGAADGAGASDALAIPPADGLMVWDYCLQTTPTALVGRYVGTYTTDVFPENVFDLEADLFIATDGQLRARLSEPECPSCGQSAIGYLFPQTVPVTVGDGWIAFDIASPTICNAVLPPPTAKLFSQRNTLAGDYHDKLLGGGGGGDGAYCAHGTLSLTRQP